MTYSYDTQSRLTSLSTLAASAWSNTVSLSYTDANQIKTRSNSNVSFDAPVPADFTTPYTANGLKQIASVSGV